MVDCADSTIILAAEIEWYLWSQQQEPTQIDRQLYLNELQKSAEARGLPLYALDIEKGCSQVEAALPICANAAELVANLELLKELAQQTAADLALQADFSAKPLADDYGSGLHIHLHLENSLGENLFWKNDESMSAELQHCLAGLLVTMPKYMPIFAPNEAAYKRFVGGFNAPVNASWGGNNRTVALRLPDSFTNYKRGMTSANNPSKYRRIEHRVAASEANPQAVITAICAGIAYGLREKPTLPPPIYGDAADAQYGLEKFIC